jgi:hypothetical protein
MIGAKLRANLKGVFSLLSKALKEYVGGLWLTPTVCYAMFLFGWIVEKGCFGRIGLLRYKIKN